MSKTFELLVESLTEIIEDMEKTGGKNLKHKILSVEDFNKQQKIFDKKKSLVPNSQPLAPNLEVI